MWDRKVGRSLWYVWTTSEELQGGAVDTRSRPGSAGQLQFPPGLTVEQGTAGPQEKHGDLQPQRSESFLSAFADPILL